MFLHTNTEKSFRKMINYCDTYKPAIVQIFSMVSMAFMVSLLYVAHCFMFVHTERNSQKFKFAFAHIASSKRGEKEFNPNISDVENFSP